MKSANLLCVGRTVSACLLGTLFVGSTASAVQVDSELVILVDLSNSVNATEFANTMESVALTFEDSNVVNAITMGAVGSVATSLVFFAGANQQQVGVSWMEVNDASSAAQFAAAVRAATRPFGGRSAIGTALAYAATTFGLETGGVANGFESNRQLVTIFADGRDNDTPAPGGSGRRMRDARETALVAGVDEISAVVLNPTNGSLESYYQSNVVGGDGSSTPSVTLVDPDSVEQSEVTASVGSTLQGSPLTPIPEPSSLILLGGSSVLFLRRRRSIEGKSSLEVEPWQKRKR